jgi:hypothetical protein
VAQPYFFGFTPVGPQVSLCKIPEKLSFLVQQGVPLSKSENIFTKPSTEYMLSWNQITPILVGLLEMATPLYSLIVSASFLSRMQGFPRVPIIASLSQRPSIQTGCVRIRTGVETGSISYGTRFHRATF